MAAQQSSFTTPKSSNDQKTKSTLKTRGASRVYTFSAPTCLSVLNTMSDDLVLQEYNYLQSTHPDSTVKAQNPAARKKALQKALTKSLGDQFMISVANINILADSINTTLERTKDTVEELLRNTEDAVEKTSPPPPPQETDLSSAGNQYLECPVRVCDSLRVNLTVDEVKESIHFKNKLPGGRCTEFFGLVPYAYGRVKHSPRPIPDTPVFNKIFETMGSIGLNRENCTILCTLYENGNVDLPLHQDNEPSIEEGSTIYTISCGSTRNLKVYNTTGSLREFFIPMRDGTVHAMTSESQNSWRHGIDKEPSVTTPRISFTIRKLVSVPPSSPSPSISNIPPIAPPLRHSKSRTSRVLLLTDSIHRNTPENVFEQIPNHTCVKKECYQLSDVFKYENEFEFARTVILSSGVNDLSRYGKTANVLAPYPVAPHETSRYTIRQGP